MIVFGFEAVINPKLASYTIPTGPALEFVSLGPEGRFWDHFSTNKRLRTAIRKQSSKIDMLLLRVPSHKAYFIWKYLGKPKKTLLLFVGNQYYNNAYSNNGLWMHIFRTIRSNLHDHRMNKISNHGSALIFANSPALVTLWEGILNKQVRLIKTSSISETDIVSVIPEREETQDSMRLLFVGRVCNDKGVRELLDAMALLNQQKANGYFLDIVGPEGDLGGYTISELMEKKGVSSQCKHHGVVPFGDQLFEYYSRADVYILPSYHEGMPHTIWEALAQGTPVISTPVGGVGDFFIDGFDILLIPVRDHKSIAEVVISLESNKLLRGSLIRNGLKKVRTVTREGQAKALTSTISRVWK
ncbi:MAG: glycosyltransferase [Candidatus Marinimicrobia bacterium]|nr:glycosyltransferase [Candidatus Neomarinimicrobiota bacterium]